MEGGVKNKVKHRGRVFKLVKRGRRKGKLSELGFGLALNINSLGQKQKNT